MTRRKMWRRRRERSEDVRKRWKKENEEMEKRIKNTKRK